MGGCYSCVVPVKQAEGHHFVRSCIEGPVFDAHDSSRVRRCSYLGTSVSAPPLFVRGAIGCHAGRCLPACASARIPLTLRRQPGYDHSYYFVSTFMAEHLRWHAERLRGG